MTRPWGGSISERWPENVRISIDNKKGPSTKRVRKKSISEKVLEQMGPLEGSLDRNGKWFKIGPESDIAEATAREYLVEGEVIAVFRQSGEFYAVDGICAHQGGPIAKGMVDGKCVTCPWHGWQYDIATGENKLTKRKMLRTFPIRQAGGDVEVWIANKN